jgi:hypothetical protein
MRPLALGGLNYEDLQDDEVPDDGEGRIKNPKWFIYLRNKV